MFLSNLFDSNEKQLGKIRPIVAEVNTLESEMQKLLQDEFVAQTNAWKDQFSKLQKEKHEELLNEILPRAYAMVREASVRTLGKRHYDVQIMGGVVLHQGKIAEQKTGEGKTLTATLPLYLNSLTGRGVSLVTPNDYLSRHGAGWMGTVYNYLGVSVGVIMQERAFVFDPDHENNEFDDEYATHLRVATRREAYNCDIIYGTNHEFGFDYLRDNMAGSPDELVQQTANKEFGEHFFAIVDEVDSILIDMARTPLIISTSVAQAAERYYDAAKIVSGLIKGMDFEVDEKFRTANLTDIGIRKVEKLLNVKNLYEEDFEMVHLMEQALTARGLFEKDRDYIVKDGKIVIVDQFTGRLLPNNSFSHGLHQAIEAKEGVEIREETRSVAEVSYQNYFRLYEKLAGMTGTAVTEAEEFYKIYKLDVVVIPTNKAVNRTDHNDLVYKTESAKFTAAADDIAERSKKGQPVLVGTTSVDKSQLLHELLSRRGIKAEILNAKNHEKEANIISQAGKKGAVTVSTNMAGRGVDILLGGENAAQAEYEEVVRLGGLHVIGTERHESRRIDNQLRGRAGRQGDPGSSRFYVSLQDELMRVFGGAQIEGLMNRFGMEDSIPLEAGLVSKAIENAQKKVESMNFDRRKRVVEMDDVINVHRSVVYKMRKRMLFAPEEGESFKAWFIPKLIEFTPGFDVTKHWDTFEQASSLKTWLYVVFQVSREVIDVLWMDHLTDMDNLREGIGLRGYAQKDPTVEYKNEGHAKFERLVGNIYSNIGERLTRISVESAKSEETGAFSRNRQSSFDNLNVTQSTYETGVADEAALMGAPVINRSGYKVEPVVSGVKKVGRNEPCPCGSGKKYKNCHGK